MEALWRRLRPMFLLRHVLLLRAPVPQTWCLRERCHFARLRSRAMPVCVNAPGAWAALSPRHNSRHGCHDFRMRVTRFRRIRSLRSAALA